MSSVNVCAAARLSVSQGVSVSCCVALTRTPSRKAKLLLDNRRSAGVVGMLFVCLYVERESPRAHAHATAMHFHTARVAA